MRKHVQTRRTDDMMEPRVAFCEDCGSISVAEESGPGSVHGVFDYGAATQTRDVAPPWVLPSPDVSTPSALVTGANRGLGAHLLRANAYRVALGTGRSLQFLTVSADNNSTEEVSWIAL